MVMSDRVLSACGKGHAPSQVKALAKAVHSTKSTSFMDKPD